MAFSIIDRHNISSLIFAAQNSLHEL